MGRELSESNCTVQISLDVSTVDEALRLAGYPHSGWMAVRAGVDWLEAGTGLLFLRGIEAIRALRRHYPEHPIVADMKVADGGYYFAEMVAEAGATHLDVLANAHRATLLGAVQAAAELDLTIRESGSTIRTMESGPPDSSSSPSCRSICTPEERSHEAMDIEPPPRRGVGARRALRLRRLGSRALAPGA
jgi:hypothetical protein